MGSPIAIPVHSGGLASRLRLRVGVPPVRGIEHKRVRPATSRPDVVRECDSNNRISSITGGLLLGGPVCRYRGLDLILGPEPELKSSRAQAGASRPMGL